MKYIRKINENFNQSEIDKILDKINKYGKDSLTWQELRILEEPDDDSHEARGDEDTQFVISSLIKSKKIESETINIEGDNRFEVYSIYNKLFPYFEENWLSIEVERDEDGIWAYIRGEDCRELDDEEELEVTTKERNDVFKWIEKNWVDKIPNVNVYIIDDDWDVD